MIQFVSMKCPSCGADISIDASREFGFCSYCGNKILIHNENEQIYRHIDEAKIRQAELEKEIELKRLEILAKEREAEQQSKKSKIKLGIVLGIIGVLMMIIGNGLGEASGDSDSSLYMIAIIGFFPLIGAFGLIASALKKSN